jgi:microcystin-dependent protein
MPAHDHAPESGSFVTQAAGTDERSVNAGSLSYPTATDTADAGGGEAHPNMQPTLFLNVMIKL